jgi:hypothetical protein
MPSVRFWNSSRASWLTWMRFARAASRGAKTKLMMTAAPAEAATESINDVTSPDLRRGTGRRRPDLCKPRTP